MNVKIENQVGNLAYHMWASAGREYGRALEFWTMAEQMVWELSVASARLSGSAAEVGLAIERNAPAIAAKSIQQIRALAYCMWQAAGAEWGRALDHWLAAERHVTMMLMASGAMTETSDAGPVNVHAECRHELLWDRFSPDAYLNAIRTDAYHIWENAGREYIKDALPFWLEAEQQMLYRLETAAMTPCHTPEPARREAGLPLLQPDTSEMPPAPERGNTAVAASKEPTLFRIRRLNPAQDPRVH